MVTSYSHVPEDEAYVFRLQKLCLNEKVHKSVVLEILQIMRVMTQLFLVILCPDVFKSSSFRIKHYFPFPHVIGLITDLLFSTLERQIKNIQIQWVLVDRSRIQLKNIQIRVDGFWVSNALEKQCFSSCNWSCVFGWCIYHFYIASVVFVILVFSCWFWCWVCGTSV